MKTKTVDKLFWAIFIVMGVLIVYGIVDGAKRAAECKDRGGVPVYQNRSLYPICYDPAALR